MATINNRVFKPEATVINGVQAGGTVTVNCQAGFENIYQSSPDGLQVPVEDRECQYVRGSVVIEDWIEAILLILGTLGTMVFYERKSGTAAATGYVKHTITNPVITGIRLSITKGGWATVAFTFECKFPSETATINDVWAMTDSQTAPTYVSSARGGWRISAATHNSVDIYHIMSLMFNISIPVLKACNDSDVGYTAVDAMPESGMTVGGSLGFQDATITSSQLQMNRLLVASAATLTATVTQSAGATSKLITIARAQFTSGQANAGGIDYSQYKLPFGVTNDPDTPLTLDGTNKIITIADAA